MDGYIVGVEWAQLGRDVMRSEVSVGKIHLS